MQDQPRGEADLPLPTGSRPPRVAFFPDSFHEVNGVAHTSRNLVAYAAARNLPLLSIRAGTGPSPAPSSSITILELPRSRAALRLEKDLEFDPLFARHLGRIGRALRRFRPDIIHITGPSELGIAGAYFAWRLGIPLAASWHTNLHEYAARRVTWLNRLLPRRAAARLSRAIEAASLFAITRFYALARVLFAPNPDLCRMLEQRTHRPCHLMQRGVDTALFSPARRSRPLHNGTLVIGYVGRLSVEKNVAILPQVARHLRALDLASAARPGAAMQSRSTRGLPTVRFRIIGHGNEEPALRAAMPEAEFLGVLRGEALARATADMDLLLFPSHTDTFGNVVLEALASGVPALVTPDGGPRHIVTEGSTGFVIPTPHDSASSVPASAVHLTQDPAAHTSEAAAFADRIALLAADPARLTAMRDSARAYALDCSWNAVFDKVYAGYANALESSGNQLAITPARARELTG